MFLIPKGINVIIMIPFGIKTLASPQKIDYVPDREHDMSKKPKTSKPRPVSTFTDTVEQMRQAADPGQGLRDAVRAAQSKKSVLREAIGLDDLKEQMRQAADRVQAIRDAIGLVDLKKQSQLFVTQTGMHEAITRAIARTMLPNMNAGHAASGIKATDIAKAAAFNRTLFGLDKIATALPSSIPRPPAQDMEAENAAQSAKATPLNQYQQITTAKNIGQLVRKTREARKISQQRFADLAGVGRRFISELENGKASLEFDKVVSVAAVAGIDLFARER